MDASTNVAAVATPVTEFILKLNNAIVNPIIVVMFACALFVFLWGVRAYITGADNAEVRQKGANQIMWGVIGMAIMLMTFGIIKIVLNTFGISGDPETMEAINQVLPNQ
jgi:hypothetical protein